MKKRKEWRNKMVLNNFNKNNSVFRTWKIDTQSRLKRAFELDLSHAKIKKFVNDPVIYEEVWGVLFKHSRRIKDIFTYGIGVSSFPSISWLGFWNMCTTWKIVGKGLSLNTIDRVFIATNYEEVEQEDNPDRDLWRYEFYEIIVRLAYEKYYKSKIWSSIANATEKLLGDIYERWTHYWAWQEWREEWIWTTKVNDLLKVNLVGLKKVYSSYFNQMK